MREKKALSCYKIQFINLGGTLSKGNHHLKKKNRTNNLFQQEILVSRQECDYKQDIDIVTKYVTKRYIIQ
jgi:ribosomal protein S18